MITNERIIEVAKLVLSMTAAETEHFESLTAEFTGQDCVLATVAERLLQGRRYTVHSDNPETIRRCRSLAADMGATVALLDVEMPGEAITKVPQKIALAFVQPMGNA
jgi:uncharacterized protein (UPF0179 family)